MINNTPQTEQIYIHSKLMIVDDRTVILGSANINDRSLNGNRDSELAVLIKDQCQVVSRMDGQSYQASAFALGLRLKLFKEHFDMTVEQLQDPLSDQLFEDIREQSACNTAIYRRVFGCYPDDQMKSFQDIKTISNQADITLYA